MKIPLYVAWVFLHAWVIWRLVEATSWAFFWQQLGLGVLSWLAYFAAKAAKS